MTEYICKMTLRILCENSIIEEENVEIYHYGLELILATIFKFIGLMIIATIAGLVKEAIIFILFFSGLRLQAGGYHARTIMGCFIGMASFTFVSINLVKILPLHHQLNYILVSMIISIFLIFLYAPLESENKPSTEEQKIEYRYRSLATGIIGSIIILFLIYLSRKFIYFGTIASTGFLIESLTLIHSRKVGYD